MGDTAERAVSASVRTHFPVDLWLDPETCGGQEQTRPGASESMLCDDEMITPRLAPTWVGFVTVAPPRSDIPAQFRACTDKTDPTKLARSTIMYSLQKRVSRSHLSNPHNLRQPRCVTVLPRRRSRPGSLGRGRKEPGCTLQDARGNENDQDEAPPWYCSRPVVLSRGAGQILTGHKPRDICSTYIATSHNSATP